MSNSLVKEWRERRCLLSILQTVNFSFRLPRIFARASTLPKDGSMSCFLMVSALNEKT